MWCCVFSISSDCGFTFDSSLPPYVENGNPSLMNQTLMEVYATYIPHQKLSWTHQQNWSYNYPEHSWPALTLRKSCSIEQGERGVDSMCMNKIDNAKNILLTWPSSAIAVQIYIRNCLVIFFWHCLKVTEMYATPFSAMTKRSAKISPLHFSNHWF